MKHTKTFTIILALVALSVLQFACSDKTTDPPPAPPAVYKIAFSLDVAGAEQNQICTINPDGTELTSLTSSSTNDNPIWSPDGAYIYYKDFMDEANEIIRMSSTDGTGKTNLTNYSGLDRLCDISPDGTKMALVSNRDLGVFNLYVMDLGTMAMTNITSGLGFESRHVKFTPNGLQLIYSVNNEGKYNICLDDIDGGQHTVLSNLDRDDTYGVVSPDGSKVAYVSATEGGPSDIWVCSIGGSDRTQVSNSPHYKAEPEWSPDGQRILFTESIDMGTANIFVVDPDGSNLVCLTDSAAVYYNPKWSPDGRQIAYIAITGEPSQLCVMKSDGSEKTQLTQNIGSGRAYSPNWSPAL